LDYGLACSDSYPAFIDIDSDLHWDGTGCRPECFADTTGVDSLDSFLLAIIAFVSIQTIEYYRGVAIFEFGGSGGYIKDTTEHPLAKQSKSQANF
jgi:hypothetical protein